MESLDTCILAALASVNALQERVKGYKSRDKTLGRLQSSLEDLTTVLSLLKEVDIDESPNFTLLTGPVSRCDEMCREFRASMEGFNKEPDTGSKDWTKMEFMKGSISEFIDTLSNYKSTIQTGLGIIIVHTSTVTQQVVEEYNEMIQDTAYNLAIQLQRIEEKVGSVATNTTLQGGQPAVLAEQPRERLDSSDFDRGPDRETLWLVKEAEIANQGLELCTQVSKQLPTQTIHIIDEAICEGNSSQVVVTTLADLFVVGKVKAKKNSSQLVGSMDSATLIALVKRHYGSG